MIELRDRWLTNAGVSIVEPSSPLILQFLKDHVPFRVTEITQQIAQFNKLNAEQIKVPSTADFKIAGRTVVLPPTYRSLDVDTYVARKLVADCKRNAIDSKKRQTIAGEELQWFYEHDRYDLIRTIVYVLDTLESNSVPWGVGRGSSVNSYVLFLLGLHDIDPIKHGLDWREFLRD